MNIHVKIIAYYVSRDRVLTLLNPKTLPKSLMACLEGKDVSRLLFSNSANVCIDCRIEDNVRFQHETSWKRALAIVHSFRQNDEITGGVHLLLGFSWSRPPLSEGVQRPV